jgi:hypothetical protein
MVRRSVSKPRLFGFGASHGSIAKWPQVPLCPESTRRLKRRFGLDSLLTKC